MDPYGIRETAMEPGKAGSLLLLLVALALMFIPACVPAVGTLALHESQELRVTIAGGIGSLDPHDAPGEGTAVVRQIFRGLLWYDEHLNLVPMAAREVPTIQNGGISRDGLTYTFRLRDGLQWSDGRALTADDFAYGIKRLLDPVHRFTASAYYMIEGAEKLHTSRDPGAWDRLRSQVGIRAADDRTLVVSLNRPGIILLFAMVPPAASPLRRDVIEEHGERWTEPGHLIGDGPFELSEQVGRERLVLEPNPHWWGSEAPRLKKITVISNDNAGLSYRAYLAGQVDVTLVPPPVKEQVLADPQLSHEVVRPPRGTVLAILFNVTRSPFNDPKVRKAFSLAIDRESLTKALYMGEGEGEAAYSLIPPRMPGHDKDLGRELAFNPAKARETLADAGYPGGAGLPPLSYMHPRVNIAPRVAQQVQAELKQNLGIEVSLDPEDVLTAKAREDRRDFQLTHSFIGSPSPDPEVALIRWTCADYEAGRCAIYGGPVPTGYANPEFDRTLALATKETNVKRRLDLLERAHRILVEDAPAIWVTYPTNSLLVKPYVRDLIDLPIGGAPGAWFWTRTYIAAH